MNIYDTFTVIGSKCSVSFLYEGYDGPSVVNSTGALEKTVLRIECFIPLHIFC